MLSSQVLRAIQLASLGLGCATSPTAEASAPPRAVETKAAMPPLSMTSRVRSKMATAARPDAALAERREAIRAIADMSEPSAVIPLMLLLENSSERALEAELRRALRKLGAGAELAKRAKADDPAVRKQAIDLLRVWCDREDESANEAMRAGLRDPNAEVRAAAATAVGWCEDATATGQLIDRLKIDPDSEVRSAAAQALGRSKDERSARALEAALAVETDEFVRAFIRSALNRHRRRSSEGPDLRP